MQASTLGELSAGGVIQTPDVTFSSTAPRLTADELMRLERDGYVTVDGLTTREEIAFLRGLYDRMFAEQRGWKTGDLFDMVSRDNLEKGLSLPQMLWPSRYEPQLRKTRLFASACGIAHQILGPGLENTLEHAILKPASAGAATPWHQDDAFSRKGTGFTKVISIWMPLQDATPANGCMKYVPGSNHGPLYPHRSPGNDPSVHGLEVTTKVDETAAQHAPVNAGGAVIHLSRTLHAAGVNTSAEPRRAYILGFALKTRPHGLFVKDYPWNLEKHTLREERELQGLSPVRRTVRRLRRMLRGQKY
jgi:ectoine hydroxylase-related dioxygenase (phytanoyl-CoA dioxygenase family)